MDYHADFIAAILEPSFDKVCYYLDSKKIDPNRQIGVTVDGTGGRIKYINVGSYLFLAVTHYYFRGHTTQNRIILLRIVNKLVKQGARIDQVDYQNGINVLEFAGTVWRLELNCGLFYFMTNMYFLGSLNDRHLILALMYH